MPKTVLITGCSSGFGAATARHFAGQGWNVIATMRHVAADPGLGALARTLVARLDVEDGTSIDQAIKDGIAQFGRIDVLVNNAGFGAFGIFEETPRTKMISQFNVNVFGVMDVTRAILPHFRANRGGVVVNVGSGAGVFALPMISLYCASKFALEGFSEALSYELADLGIGVKMVEPGGVTATNFGARSGAEAAGAQSIGDYAPFITATHEMFGDLRAQRANATSEDVAQVIFQAATDPSNRLRYVATDDILPLVQARRESSEEAYMAFMRARVTPNVKR